MPYYKVVRQFGDHLCSMSFWEPGIVLEYPINEWVRANFGGLLVYDSLVEARSIAREVYCLKVFECEVREEVPLPPKRLDFIKGQNDLPKWLERAKRLWEGQDDGDCLWPLGTRAFKEVKLIGRVE